jgi:hypothetical protein
MALWNGFLQEIKDQFADSQKEMRARQEISKLKMKYPKVDDYIAKFEELARIVEYHTSSMETLQLFLNGLQSKARLPITCAGAELMSPGPNGCNLGEKVG